jgi:hypothetical protein
MRVNAISHKWLEKFIEHRIADRRVLRHIKKWLNAGVLEDGNRIYDEEGVPQRWQYDSLNAKGNFEFDRLIKNYRGNKKC